MGFCGVGYPSTRHTRRNSFAKPPRRPTEMSAKPNQSAIRRNAAANSTAVSCGAPPSRCAALTTL